MALEAHQMIQDTVCSRARGWSVSQVAREVSCAAARQPIASREPVFGTVSRELSSAFMKLRKLRQAHDFVNAPATPRPIRHW